MHSQTDHSINAECHKSRDNLGSTKRKMTPPLQGGPNSVKADFSSERVKARSLWDGIFKELKGKKKNKKQNPIN